MTSSEAALVRERMGIAKGRKGGRKEEGEEARVKLQAEEGTSGKDVLT